MCAELDLFIRILKAYSENNIPFAFSRGSQKVNREEMIKKWLRTLKRFYTKVWDGEKKGKTFDITKDVAQKLYKQIEITDALRFPFDRKIFFKLKLLSKRNSWHMSMRMEFKSKISTLILMKKSKVELSS